MRSKALVYPQMQVRRVARRCAPSLSNLMIEAIFLFFSFLLPPALLCALLITNTQSPSHSPFILPAYQGHFADKGIFFFFFFVCVCVCVCVLDVYSLGTAPRLHTSLRCPSISINILCRSSQVGPCPHYTIVLHLLSN